MAVGSILDGLIPGLWDSSPLSLSTVLFSGIGGIAGIYVGYTLAV